MATTCKRCGDSRKVRGMGGMFEKCQACDPAKVLTKDIDSIFADAEKKLAELDRQAVNDTTLVIKQRGRPKKEAVA